jgi:hypothetical protein
MRISIILMSALAVLALAACAKITEKATEQAAMKKANACVRDVATSSEAVKVYKRLWLGDGNDTPDKLRDPAPLTPEEKNALTQLHGKMLQCRQIPASSSSPPDARETAYRDEYFQRSTAVYYKLESDDLPVGVANKLFIESNGKFQADMLRDRLPGVGPDAIEAQQDAEKMVQEYDQAAAAEQNRQAQQRQSQQRRSKQHPSQQSQPEQTVTTPNCTWVGNTLNCTTAR